MDTKIFLQKFLARNKSNKSQGINVDLSGNRKLLPPSPVEEYVNLNEQYLKEREETTKIRLTVQVNPICTNVLCNNITEIVRYEGSDDVEVLNYKKFTLTEQDKKNILYKKNHIWTGYNPNMGNPNEIRCKNTIKNIETYNAIRDTQLSQKEIGFIYHCGKDIFNNHLLRSKTFKAICQRNKNGQNKIDKEFFNTIEDGMRDMLGDDVLDYVFYPISAPQEYKEREKKPIHLHVYSYDDISSYKYTLENKMKLGYDGWLGFMNSPKMETFKTINKEDKELGISLPILYKNAGDFIDMYPTRDLFLFNPLYNKSRHRIEKNWNYCITYPSSSTTNVDFINQELNSLKAVGIDENTKNDNGAGQFVVFSVSKHGLMINDTVNVYKTYNVSGETINEKVCDNSRVIDIVDDYTFVVYNNNNVSVSSKWIDANDTTAIAKEGLRSTGNSDYYYNDKGKKYYVINGKINVDDTAQNISYKKTVGGIESEYYVRIFSRLPNFKFADRKPTEYELYKENSTLLNDYQNLIEDFESHASKLAFANNIYGDSISEIVYTDDLDIANIRDNRGRPITSLYLTIIKNNKGYKKWYGKEGEDYIIDDKKVEIGNEKIDIKSEDIEYSHCFGKVNSAFLQSDEAFQTDGDYITIQRLQNIDKENNKVKYPGLNQNEINKHKLNERIENKDSEDEIDYYTDIHFYGDLVSFDNITCQETVIQNVCHRFNTAQRELTNNDKAFQYFIGYFYDEIKSDDYDKDGFYLKGNKIKDSSTPWPKMGTDNNPVCQRKEGYYYEPHYEIPIHTYGRMISVFPNFLSIRTYKSVGVGKSSSKDIYVLQTHFLEKGDKVMLYDIDNEEYYIGLVKECVTPKEFICDFYDKDDKLSNDKVPYSLSRENKLKYKLFKIDNLEIPTYAEIIKDGSCRLVWRPVEHNGVKENDSIETYPFTNGALYINKPINLVVKRQDAFDMYDMVGNAEPFDRIGVGIKDGIIDDSYSSDEIRC